jgi:hypothetical protein
LGRLGEEDSPQMRVSRDLDLEEVPPLRKVLAGRETS